MSDDKIRPESIHRDTRLAQTGSREPSTPLVPSTLETTLADLEGGGQAFAFDSGGSALEAALQLVPQGTRVLVSESWRGGAWSRHSWVRSLVPVSFDPTLSTSVRKALNGGASAILVDTPSDPVLGISSIRDLSRQAHAQGALLIVDNAGLTGYFQKPLDHGADVVVYGTAQALAGHIPAKAGVVVTRRPDIGQNLSEIRASENSSLSIGDAWLVLQGLRTLHLRAERSQSSARKIAQWLDRHPRVGKVFFPQDPRHENAAVHLEQSSGPGWNLAFEVTAPWLAQAFLKSLRVWILSDARGTCESTASAPYTGSHRDLPESSLRALGISESLIRLSVGLEDVDDLLKDLDQALRRPLEGSPGETSWVI